MRPDIRQALKEVADKEERSVSQIIERFVREGIERRGFNHSSPAA